jgi:hypothetical protein
MNESEIRPKPWQYSLRVLFVLMFIVAGLCASFACFRQWYIKTHYPYGWSHCCDKILAMSLEEYAVAHNGAYPSGERWPEASLSLLYPKYLDIVEILRGKTVPLDIVEKRLQKGEKLGPNSCGWHYVEGLTKKDDSRLGLVWDKTGLGHNGQLLQKGGHYVIFVNSDIKYINGKHWDEFEDLQEILLLKKGLNLSTISDIELEKKWRSITDEDQSE